MAAAASCSRYRARTAFGLTPTYAANSRCSDRTLIAPSAATWSTRTSSRSSIIAPTSPSRSRYGSGASGAVGASAASRTAERSSSSSSARTADSSSPADSPSCRSSGATLSRPGSTPVSAAKPPGRNLAAVTRPAPTRSTLKRRVTTPCSRTAGRSWPKRGWVPCSTETFTLGWLSTSERNGGCPARSHRTDQYRSTKGRSGSATRASRRRFACSATSAGRRMPRSVAARSSAPVAFFQDATAAA